MHLSIEENEDNMDKIIKFPVDTGKVVISEDTKSTLRNLFSGCRKLISLVAPDFLQIC